MPMKLVAVWFRNDLRVHDNGSLHAAAQLIKNNVAKYVLPVYVYDPRIFGKDALSRLTRIPKLGLHRQRFIAESLRDLRQSLRKIGSDLLIVEGLPEDVFTKLLPRGSTIYTQREVTQEEQNVDMLVKRAGFDIQTLWGLTMYDLNDILARRGQQGADFTSCMAMMSKLQQSGIRPRRCLPTPKAGELPFPTNTAHDDNVKKFYEKARAQEPYLYSHEDGSRAVYDNEYTYQVDPRGVFGALKSRPPGIRGGESVGLSRVEYYIQPRLLDNYKNTRNGMLHGDYSSKFSAWLAHGCISPRLIYWLVKQHENKHGGPNPGTQHFLLEMGFRDFFIFYTRIHNPKIFFLDGVRPRKDAEWLPSDRAMPLFRKWIRGETGHPLVDANMLELKNSGFMSNRGRQNVASFLIYNLQVDWRWGAEYFETMLVDHHVCSNWGNWHSVAGLQNGGKPFDILKQSKMYDRKGSYVRHWIPELHCVPEALVHEPWKWGGRNKLKPTKGGYFLLEPLSARSVLPKSQRRRFLTAEDQLAALLEDMKKKPEEKSDRKGPTIVEFCAMLAKQRFEPETNEELRAAIQACINGLTGKGKYPSAPLPDNDFKSPHAKSGWLGAPWAGGRKLSNSHEMDELPSSNQHPTFSDTADATNFKTVVAVSTGAQPTGTTPITTSLDALMNTTNTSPDSASTHHHTVTTNFNAIATAATTSFATLMSKSADTATETPVIDAANTFLSVSVNALSTSAQTPGTDTSPVTPVADAVHVSALDPAATATATTVAASVTGFVPKPAMQASDWTPQDSVAVGVILVCVMLSVALLIVKVTSRILRSHEKDDIEQKSPLVPAHRSSTTSPKPIGIM